MKKTKIESLFHKYKEMIDNQKDSNKIFKNSGMGNVSKKLDFGFFPLGSGIFTDKSKIDEAETPENGVMFLGNDFGTRSYFDGIKNKSEEKTRTIQKSEFNSFEREMKDISIKDKVEKLNLK